MLKIYIISSLYNHKRVTILREKLSFHNIHLTYDWAEHASDAIGGTQNKEHNYLNSLAQLEINGVKEADLLLLVMPARSGSHFEFGLAYCLDKPIIYLDDTDTPTNEKWLEPIHHLDNVYYTESERDALGHVVIYNNYRTLFPSEPINKATLYEPECG